LDPMRSAEPQLMNRGAQPDFDSRGARSVSHRAADLPEAQARIEKSSGPWRLESGNAAERFARHLRERSGRHAPAGLNRGKLLRRRAPDLHRVGKVKIAADRAPQTPLQHARKSLRRAITGMREKFAQRVLRH